MVVVGIVFAVVSAAFLRRLGRSWSWSEGAVFCGWVALSALIYSILFYAVAASVADLVEWLHSYFSSLRSDSALPRCGVAATILAAGAVAFGFRFYFRACYGLTEVALGVVAGTRALTSQPIGRLEIGPALFLVVLTGSIYLMVRGGDNIYQGACKQAIAKPEDRLVRWVVAKIRR